MDCGEDYAVWARCLRAEWRKLRLCSGRTCLRHQLGEAQGHANRQRAFLSRGCAAIVLVKDKAGISRGRYAIASGSVARGRREQSSECAQKPNRREQFHTALLETRALSDGCAHGKRRLQRVSKTTCPPSFGIRASRCAAGNDREFEGSRMRVRTVAATTQQAQLLAARR